MQTADQQRWTRPGLIVHRESDAWHVDLVEDVSSNAKTLPAIEGNRELRNRPIILETRDVRSAHALYGPVREVVREMARRLDDHEEAP